MSKSKEKGAVYERFTKEILFLKNIKWINDDNEEIYFDKEFEDSDKIIGASSAKHQIDIHLISSTNPDCHLLCECKTHNQAVEKAHACSFVTVINDIKKKHEHWKVIPVFAADRFQSGAKKILLFYEIIGLEMKDCREKTWKFSTEVKIISPNIIEIRGKLEDGTIVDNKASFNNLSRGPCNIFDAMGSFELVDDKNKMIETITEYYGKFHTGNRSVIYDEYDEFIESKTGRKLVYIEGETAKRTDKPYSEIGSDIINSSLFTTIKLVGGGIYAVYKDGTCKCIKRKGQ